MRTTSCGRPLRETVIRWSRRGGPHSRLLRNSERPPRRRAQVRPRGNLWPAVTCLEPCLCRGNQGRVGIGPGLTGIAGHHSPAAVQPVGRHARQARVTPVGGGLGYPRSMDLGAFGRIAAGVTSTLVVAGVLPIAGPLRVDDQQAGTSHRDHRGRNRLIALLAAGLLVAACSADGRSTGSPPVPPDPTATTMKRTLPAAPKVPTTAHPGRRRR